MHISSINPRVYALWAYAAAGMARQRTPIAERAALARQVSLPLEQARQLISRPVYRGKEVFCFDNNNILQVHRLNKSNANFSSDLLPIIVRHLMPAFIGCAVRLWAMDSKEFPGAININLWAARPDNEKNALLALNFDIRESDLFLQTVHSWQKGLGGKALVAVYNIARDLKMARIKFEVPRDRLHAQFVYFHLDFGRPLNHERTEWEVRVK